MNSPHADPGIAVECRQTIYAGAMDYPGFEASWSCMPLCMGWREKKRSLTAAACGKVVGSCIDETEFSHTNLFFIVILKATSAVTLKATSALVSWPVE